MYPVGKHSCKVELWWFEMWLQFLMSLHNMGAQFLPTWGFIIPHVSTLHDNKSDCIWPWKQGNKSFCLNLPGAHSGESSFQHESVSRWRWVIGNAHTEGEGQRPPHKRPALSHYAHSSLIRRQLLSSQCSRNILLDPS